MATNKEFYVKHGLKVSGNSLLNGTTYTDSAAAKLHVKTAANGVGANLNNVNGIIVENSGSSDSNYALKLATGAGNIFNVTNSGEVGIGTTNTAAKLHLYTNQAEDLIFRMDSNSTGDAFIELDRQTSAGTSAIVFQDSSTDVWGLGTLGADRFDIFENSSTARLSIIPGGNVGIGNTNPQGTLDLGDATRGKSIVWGGSSGTSHYTSIWSEYGTGSLILAGGLKSSTTNQDFIYPYTGNYGYAAIELDSFTDDGIKFYTCADAARTAGAVATKQERMRIDTSGNVGIGTADPDTIFHVQGTSFSTFERNTSLTNVTRTAADFDHTTSGDMAAGFGSQIRFSGGDTGCSEATFAMLRGLRGSTDSEGEFSITAGTNGGEEFMRIDTSGNVGIGTSTPTNYFSGADNLVICGGSTDSGITIATDATSSGALYFADGTTGSQAYRGGIAYIHDTSNEHLALVSGGVSQMRVCTDGQLQFNTYGSGTHTGTQSYNLGVDSSGNIIEIDLGDGVIDGSGTANRFAYWSDTSTLTADSDLYYDSTNNYIGIGTDTPGEAIDIVNGNVQADEFIGNLRGAVLFKAKAGEALTKGDAVYISGISGNTTVVSKADADDAAKMPAFGIADETVSLNSSVDVIKFGAVSNLDTSNWLEGTELYVGTTAGALVSSAPTGESAAIQKIAKVTRQDNSAGSITVMGAGRTNAVPNLNEGHLFVGNASNQAVSDNTVHVDIANSRVGVGTTSPQGKLDINTETAEPTHVYINGEINQNKLLYFRHYANSEAANNVALGYIGSNGIDNLLSLGHLNSSGVDVPIMHLTEAGDVGIGTTNPTAKLHIFPGTDTTPQFKMFGANADGIRISMGVDDADDTAGIYAWDENDGSGAAFADLNLGVSHTSSQNGIFICGSNQNVGIGTTSPSALLTIHQALNTNEGGLRIENSDNSSAFRAWKQPSGGASVLVDNGVDTLFLKNGDVGVGTDDPTGKLQIGDNYTINSSYGGDHIFIKGTTGRTSYDPNVTSTDDFGTLITISNSNTVGPTKPGLVLHNDDVTAGGFSPMLLFSKRETGSSPYKAAMAGIYARSPLGTGDSDAWIDGELIFATAGAASQGIKQRMVINKEGNVGIGTTNPNSLLHIDTGANSAANFRLGANRTSANAAVGQVAGDWNGTVVSKIAFKTGDDTTNKDNGEITFEVAAAGTTAEAMRIDSSGNVGIGTDAPIGELDVYRQNSGAPGLIARADRDGAKMNFGYINNNSLGEIGTTYNTGTGGMRLWIGGNLNSNSTSHVEPTQQGTSSSSWFSEYNTNNDYYQINRIAAGGGTTSSTLFHINSAGNVGIGTDSPNYKLEIDGTTDFGNTTTYDNGAAGLISWNSGTKFKIKGQSGHALSLGANGTEDYVWIATDGNVGVGTDDPNEALTVTGNISASGTVYGNASEFGAMTEAGLKSEGVNELPEGTVLVWQDGENKPCTTEADFRVMGVSLPGSDAPIVIGAEPVLVTGPVLEGQFIITSDKEGHGKAISYAEMYTVPGRYHGKVIAQALENGDGESYTIKAMIRKM